MLLIYSITLQLIIRSKKMPRRHRSKSPKAGGAKRRKSPRRRSRSRSRKGGCGMCGGARRHH
jgi:hypothetical protein